MSFDWNALLQLAPLALAKPGSPQAAALMQGYLESQQRIERERHQQAQEQSLLGLRQAEAQHWTNEDARAQAAEGRAQDAARLGRLNAFYQQAQKLSQQAAATAENPVQANLALAKQLTGLAGGLGVEPGQGMAFVPNMTEVVSQKRQRQAKDLYNQAAQLYAPKDEKGNITDAGWENSLTLKTPQFGQVTPAALRQLFAPAAGINGQSVVPPATRPATTTDANYMLNGRPVVAMRQNGRLFYRGKDVTDQVTPYVPPSTAPDTRLDRSYNESVKRLDALKKPVLDTAARLSKLSDTVAQNTPQADALVAPELLTVMAGGLGSGLRMNEAEIARIVGGRSAWENLRAAAQHWSADPSSANTITPAQREQIRSLMTTVRNKVNAKLAAFDQAGQTLVDAQTVQTHRASVAALERRLTAIDTETGNGTSSPRQSIPGIPGGEAELQNGKWIRVK